MTAKKVFSDRVSGQVTIFSAIIMLAVLILAGLLVDLSRINSGRTMVKRAADSAVRSLLADYGSKLKESYGLFAISAIDAAKLEDQFEENLACNLSIAVDGGYYNGTTDLFGFRIEKVSVTPIYNLSENSVTKKQILEYMKYRAPGELAEGFIERLSAISETGSMAEAYKQKVSIDKILGGMDKSQQKLKKYIDGIGSDIGSFINGFNMNNAWEAAYNHFNSMAESLASAQISLNSVSGAIGDIEARLAELKAHNNDDADIFGDPDNGINEGDAAGGDAQAEKPGGLTKDLENRLDSLKSERNTLLQSCSDLENEMRQIWNNVRYSLTSDYIKSNDNAVKEIEKIAEKGLKAQQSIKKLEQYLKENFNGGKGTFSGDFKDQLQSELDHLKTLVLDGKKAEEMLERVGGNSALLKDIADIMDNAAGAATGAAGATAGAKYGLPAELLNLVRDYDYISYDYIKPVKGDSKDDPRNGKAEEVRKFVNDKIMHDINYVTEGIDKNDLPSRTKVITDDFDLKDEAFTNEQRPAGNYSGRSSAGAVYEGNLESIDDEVDFYDEDGTFQENALGFIADMGNLAANMAIDFRDNIYINEYIMGAFKNAVPALKYGSETIEDKNLHGMAKGKTDTFYNSEVEYILHGQPSQQLNCIMTKAELLLARFGLNTLHVYTDAKKRTTAASIATAVAGWWTGGAGIPVISNLIMCGWGMGEAVIDVMDLMDGKSVPIYKMKGDWRLDIGIASETGPKTDKRLYFNYYDYLRLFLLTMNENKKLDRLEDLVQLNIGKTKNNFKMSESCTYVRVEAEVSMKYLFITRPFAAKELKTGDGRYVFKVLVYEGY